MNNVITPVLTYNNLEECKSSILKENKGKSGVYRLINRISHESYIGSSINITNRLRKYYSTNYIKDKIIRDNSRIYRALLKNGYCNFYLEILEYCDKSLIIKREQYYLDLVKPEYNILKTAGSLLGFRHSKLTLIKFKTRTSSTGYPTVIISDVTNSVRKYSSIRKAAKSLNISHTMLLRYIKTNKKITGITVKSYNQGGIT
jgi:GIY-YIG catalytic domain/NUMOD1 domain